MLKAVKISLLTILTFSLFFTSACKQKFFKEESVEEVNELNSKSIPVEADMRDEDVEIWSWFSFDKVIKEFEAKNLGIKIKQRIIPFDDCNKEYIKAIANGTGPDIFVFDSNFFGEYTVEDFLQNLLEEPFNAIKYRNDFLGWESGFSFDGTQLISISYSTAPYITMYRADIMKENGFPSEPEEFGNFLENSDNLYKVAIKLKEQDKYIFQNPTDITDMVCATMGYFDNELNYKPKGDLFASSIDFSQKMYDNELISNKSFWHDAGKKAIQEDRLVMLFLASYTMINLEEYVPEQKGKWRVAKAPLGIAAWGSDTRLSINKQGKNKEEAWKVLEHIVMSFKGIENVVPSYIPALSDEIYINKDKEFFGDQKIYPVLTELAKNMTQYKLTPLDEQARKAYLSEMWQNLVYKYDAWEGIERIKKRVEKKVAEEKAMLLK